MKRTVVHFLVIVACIVLYCDVASAQRRSGSEFDLLNRGDIQDQIGLSDSQKESLSEMRDNSNVSREVFDEFREKLSAAESEEDRTKIREELNAAVQQARLDFQEKAIGVLNADQKQKLRLLFVESSGIRALLDSRVAGELGLSDEQMSSLEEINEERRTAARELGFNASDEDRQKFETEWEGKFLAVLNEDQKAKWSAQTAKAEATAAELAQSDETGAAGAPAGTQADPSGSTGAGMRSTEPPEGAEVVSSFGAAADSEETAQADPTARVYSFNFRYAPWEPLLEEFAGRAGYTLDLQQVPPGSFSHLDNGKYTAEEALDIMNGYLLRQGYALVKKQGFLVCVNVDNGIHPTLIPDVPEAELPNRLKNELVRTQFLLEGLEVGVMAQEVEALLGPYGSMTAFTQTGELIIVDIASNLQRIQGFLNAAMERGVAAGMQFKSYPLKNIAVEEAETLLLTQFGMRAGAPNVSESRSRSTGTVSATADGLQVASDLRTNSLFITGNRSQHKLVETILAAIDVSEGPDGQPLDRSMNRGPYLEVYQITSGDAREVAKSIDAMMPGVVVNEEGRTGRIHIWANKTQQDKVAEWIQQFSGGGGTGEVAVIALAQMDPLSASAMLRSLFIAEGDGAPTIETDLYGRRLIIRGSVEQITQIRKVLSDLGEDGTGVRDRTAGGPLRRYSLQGRSPEEILKYVQEAWEASEPNPIRISVPSLQGPIKDLRTPEGSIRDQREEVSEPTTGTQARLNRRPSRRGPRVTSDRYQTASAAAADSPDEAELVSIRRNGRHTSVTSRTFSDETAEPAEQPAEDGSQATDTKKSADEESVQITVLGDELILSSNDELALNRMEDLLDQIQQSLPYRTSWTVFYLRSADATETASMLEQLFPQSSVSSGAGGGSMFGDAFSAFTDPLAEMTGLNSLGMNPQTLRIIPDISSNSLFVTGPDQAVRDVEQMLQVLDSTDIPESLRDMKPRTIAVEYSDIDEMATIIRDVFKPYMEAQGGGGGRNQNPFAALMGGGRGNEEAQQVRMTLGVDRQTSSLIVSSSESIFSEVEQMVRSVDESARAANRTFRIVQLQNADAVQVQNSLINLVPRISSSSTRPGSGSSSSNNGSSGGSSNSGGQSSSGPSREQQDAFRRAMEQRMRSGGGSPFGGGGASSPFGGRSSGGRPSGGTGGGGFRGFGRGGR